MISGDRFPVVLRPVPRRMSEHGSDIPNVAFQRFRLDVGLRPQGIQPEWFGAVPTNC
jgi:hypothetical protein